MSFVVMDADASNDQKPVCKYTESLMDEVDARALQWNYTYEMTHDYSPVVSDEEIIITNEQLLPELEIAMLSELLDESYGCSLNSLRGLTMKGAIAIEGAILLQPEPQRLALNRRYLNESNAKEDIYDALLQLVAISSSPSDNIDKMSACRTSKPANNGSSCNVVNGIMTLYVLASASTEQEQDLKYTLYSTLRESIQSGVFNNGTIHSNIQNVIMQEDVDPSVSDGADLEMQLRNGVGEWIWIGTLLCAIAMIIVFGAIAGYKKYKYDEKGKDNLKKEEHDEELQAAKSLQAAVVTSEVPDGSMEILHKHVSSDICKSMFGQKPAFYGNITMLSGRDKELHT